jgi:hypothetical protein
MPKAQIVPDESQIKGMMASANEVAYIKKNTVPCDPRTGLSSEKPERSYADIVAGRDMSIKYVPSEEDILRFKQKNPYVTIDSNGLFSEKNHLDLEESDITLPEPSALFL